MFAVMRDCGRVILVAYLLEVVLWLLPKDEPGRAFRLAMAEYATAARLSLDRRYVQAKAEFR